MVIFFSGRSFPVLNLVIRLRMHMSDLSPGLICTAHQPFPTDCACCVQYPDSLISLLCLPPTELMTFHLFIRNYGSAWAWRPSLTTWHYIKLRPPLFFFSPPLVPPSLSSFSLSLRWPITLPNYIQWPHYEWWQGTERTWASEQL